MEKDLFDILNKIDKVEPSPFLYTRIKEKIDHLNEESVSFRLAFGFVSGILLLVLINLFAIKGTFNNNISENQIIESMQLIDNNQLYNE